MIAFKHAVQAAALIQALALAGATSLCAQSRANCGPWVTAVGNDRFTVCWITSDAEAGAVRVAADDASPDSAQRTFFEQGSRKGQFRGRLHNVTVKGLKPATAYSYSIPPFCDTYYARTLDPDKKNCRFVMFNDIHEADELMLDEIDSDPITTDKCDFVLFDGDMSSQVDSVGDIVNFMMPCRATFADSIAIFTARGNHECRGACADEYLNFFPTSTGKTYYTFREGPAFFVVLDGGDNDSPSSFKDFRSEEASWLKTVIASKDYRDAPHRIVVLHMPPETHRQWEGKEMVRDFASILNGTRVDLMICGHEHEHLYYPAGSDKSGCDFPVFINDLHARADIKVTPKKIEISARKNKHRIDFDK